MRLAIVHYHLRKGGVTKVIASALAALGGEPVEAVVLSSTRPDEPLPCPHAVIPGLAYSVDASAQAAAELADALRVAARTHLGGDPDIWHVHNHGLGKNLNFPRSIGLLLETGARVLLQIHDFAEDGRPGNYASQLRPYQAGVFPDYQKDLYPLGPQVAYAVLNARDLQVLRNAGIPQEQSHWLPNIVSTPKLEGDTMAYHGEKPLILYPTRAIRRKNLGELLLLALTNPEFRFGTTLSPGNPQWKGIYRYWTQLADKLKIPVEFGMGERPGTDFGGLVRSARAMVTTSVGEGFGLAFLEPWLLEKPLLGRDLPEVTCDFSSNGVRLTGLYDRLPVPTGYFNEKALLSRYAESVRTTFSSYGRQVSDREIESAWDELSSGREVDFGVLDEMAQGEVLMRVAASDAGDIKPVDCRDLIDTSVIPENRRIISEVYGKEAYAEKLHSIYRSILGADAGPLDSADPDRILDQFLDLGRFRLLRT